MQVKELAEQYVAMCRHSNVEPQIQMLQEFERAGDVKPLEEFYPPLSVSEEINLQQRIYNYALKNNTNINIGQQNKILQLLNQLRDCTSNIIQQVDRLGEVMLQLKEVKFQRCEQLATSLKTIEIPDKVAFLVKNKYLIHTFHQISQQEQASFNNFITSSYVDRENKAIRQLTQIFTSRAAIVAYVQIDSKFIKYLDSKVSQLGSQDFQAAIRQMLAGERIVEQYLTKVIQESKGLFLTNKILSFTVIMEQSEQLRNMLRNNQQLVANFTTEVNRMNEIVDINAATEIAQVAEQLQSAKKQIQIIKQINQIAKLIGHEELAVKSLEIIENKKLIVRLLQKGTQLISQIQVPQQPCLYYDEGCNQVVFELYRDLVGACDFQRVLLNEFGMKARSLPEILQHTFDTLNQCWPAFNMFQYAAQTYNSIDKQISQDELFILENPINQFVEDLCKACQASTVTLNCQNGVDNNCITRLQKAQAFLGNSVLQFDKQLRLFQRVSRQVDNQLKILKNSMFSSSALSCCIKNIRDSIQQLPDGGARTYIHYQGKVCQILKQWYMQKLEGSTIASRHSNTPVTVGLSAQLEFQPPLPQIEQQLEQINAQFYDFVSNDKYQLIQDLEVSQMQQKLIDELKGIIRLQDVGVTIELLQKIQGELGQQCSVSLLANQFNDQQCFQNYPTVEQQKELYDRHISFMAQNFNSIEFLTQQFKDLLRIKSHSPPIFEVIAHSTYKEGEGETTITTAQILLNFSQVNTLVSQIPYACLQVATSAASYQCEKIAQEMLTACQQFSAKAENELNQAQTSQQIAQISQYFAQFNKAHAQKLEQDYSTLVESIGILQQQSNKKDGAVQLVQTAIGSFGTIRSKLSNLDQILKTKKQQMLSKFVEDLNGSDGIIVQAFNTQQNVVQLLDKLVSLLKDQLFIVKKSEDLKKMNSKSYKQLFLPSSIEEYFDILQQLRQIQQTSGDIYQKFMDVNDEFEKMRGEEKQIISQSDLQRIEALKDLKQLVDGVMAYSSDENMGKIYNDFVELFTSEWGVCKARLDLLDEIVQIGSHLADAQDELLKLPDGIAREVKGEVSRAFNAFRTQVQVNTSHCTQLASHALVVVRLLKSPALTKQHWMEIASKMNFRNIYNYFAGRDEFRETALPNILTGQTVFYSIQLYCFEEKSYTAAQNGLRAIVSKAEGEQSVRQALEEIVYWQQTEAKVQFGTQELSEQTMEEVNDLNKYSRIPINANWRPLLTALGEKKAIITSVKSNPFAKAVEDQIREVEASVEALTRLAIVLGAISRQLAVLEPVMARRVLPEQHKQFYQTFRLLYYVMTAVVDEEAYQSNQAQVCLSLAALLQTDIPEGLQLTVRQGGVGALGVDNSVLGVHAALVLGLEGAHARLLDVQTALREYLETKRLYFPRFYFVADTDVLEILANANSKPAETLAPHIKKLFGAIERLDVRPAASPGQFSITGFHSSEGEAVTLIRPVAITPEIPPEAWLNRLDHTIKHTVRHIILALLGVPYAQEPDLDVDPAVCALEGPFYQARELGGPARDPLGALSSCECGEALAVAVAALFAAQVDQALSSTNPDAGLRECTAQTERLLGGLVARLYEPAVATASYGTPEYVAQMRLRALAADATHHLALLGELAGRPAGRQWAWSRELKARVCRGGAVCCEALDARLAYGYEYQGPGARLVHTPLTDRCFGALTAALATGRSCNPTGPAGTGKTETVKAFAARLGRPCAVFNCDAAIAREDLARLLAGVALSGSVGCFDEVNRLSPAVLSAVAADVEAVQRAIAAPAAGLALGGLAVPAGRVSPLAAVFVTMNPAGREYRGRSELPFSLTKMLRGCWMGRADVGIIMRTALATSGFRHAPRWSAKLDLTYLLAQRRIPREVHLDWGLRSLQSVLRQAALQRASVSRGLTRQLSDAENCEMERSVIIKALSDATLSRIQHESACIFNEILRDVFGNVQQPEQQKFGAVGAVEARLAGCIQTEDERLGNLALSLYRSLTAKLGVALLGRQATGKTMVRQLLKAAVTRASGGTIKVHEFLIAPKAMSRQELLGYVDPVTKEWNDGALTRAARAAVQLLNGSERPYSWPWIVFDGEIDPNWIEALNSSLDDNRLLSLSSGERIRFPTSLDPLEAYCSCLQEDGSLPPSHSIPTPISFIFETDSLQHASPATVSRLSVILVSDLNVQQQIQFVRSQSPGVAHAVESISKNCTEADLAEVSTHMLMLEDEKDRTHCLLPLFSEFGPASNQLVQQLAGRDVTAESRLLPNHFQDKGVPQRQQYAIRLIHEFLTAGNSVVVVGQQQSGKYYCVQQAIERSQSFQLVSFACTSQSTRDDVVRTLITQCVEQQLMDGARIIRPKAAGKKLVVCLRNIDICEEDEYGHSQLYSLLWSIVAHQRIYLKQGQYVGLEGILFVATVQNHKSIPGRIRRLLGKVQLEQLSPDEKQIILGQHYPIYQNITSMAEYGAYVKQLVAQQEMVELQQKILKELAYISLPQFITQTYQINLSTILQVLRLSGLKQDQIYCMIYYFTGQSCPFAEGRAIAAKEMAKFSNQLGAQFASYHDQNTQQNIKWILSNGTSSEYQKFSSNTGRAIQFVGYDSKVKQIEGILDAAVHFTPGLALFRRAYAAMDQQLKQEYTRQITAIETSLYLTRGCVVVSQPNNFSAECAFIASLSLQQEARFISCDQFNNIIFKSICERITNNRSLVLIIDTASLEHDQQWLQLLCAMASEDRQFLRSKLNATDLRQVISMYAEKLPQDQANQNEEVLTGQFFDQLINGVSVVLLLSPERTYTNTLLGTAPPIRRRYGVVSFPIWQTSTADIISNITLKVLCPKTTQEQVKQIQSQIAAFQSTKNAKTQLTYTHQYSQIALLANHFQDQWSAVLQKRQVQLRSGLSQLQTVQKEVDILAKKAGERQTIITRAQKECNEALVQISVKMEQVSQNKIKATAMGKELSEKEVVIREKRDQAEKELGQVQPLIEEAKQAVSSIPSDAVSEVKSFNSPPPAVGIVLEAVVRLMGMNDTSWKGMKAFLAQNGVLRMIATLDIATVNPKVLDVVRRHVQTNAQHFEQANIARVSRAAAPLAKWVTANLKYLEIYARVEPLMKAAEEANARLTGLRGQLSACQKEAERLEKEAEALKKSFDGKTSDLVRYQQELEEITKKKERGDQLLAGLAGERKRWTENEAGLSKQAKQLPENALRAAALYVMAGTATDDGRDEYVGEETRQELAGWLCGAQFQDECRRGGLRASRQALENAGLLSALSALPGVRGFVLSHATDASGVRAYLRASWPQAQFISATSDNLANLIAVAARFGQTAIITDCDQGYLPPAVIPYIRYGTECYQAATPDQGDTPTIMVPATSARLSEVAAGFRLVILSSVAINVPSTCAANLLQLSFAPTQKSRTDLYTDCVLQIWSPDTLQRIQQLNARGAELKAQQERLEETLLGALEESQKSPNILDDRQLLDVLEKARQQQVEIVAAEQEIHRTEQELQLLKGKAVSIADVVVRCQMAIDLISKINELYLADDSSIMPILRSLLRNELKKQPQRGNITDQMVSSVINKLMVVVYYRISNMVFTNDKVGALVMYIRIMRPELLTEKMMHIFAGNQTTSAQSGTVPKWVMPDKENAFKMLLGALEGGDLKELDFNSPQWERVQQNILDAQELSQIQIHNVSNPFVVALTIITFRRDMLCQALLQACEQTLSTAHYSPDILQNALQMVDGLSQPIIIYTTAGQDPTTILNSNNIVALAPGREQEADQRLVDILDEIGRQLDGNTKLSYQQTSIIVKGAHLCMQWLTNLPSRLSELCVAYNNKYQEGFSAKIRIILLLEPKAGFPTNLSRISWRLCLQQQISPQQTMQSLIMELPNPPTAIKPEMQKLYYAVFYMMASIHTILESRRIFVPRGVANDPGWNQMDFFTMAQMISTTMGQHLDISIGGMLNRIVGLSTDVVYGATTRDCQDAKLVREVVELSLHKQVIQKIIDTIKGGECHGCETIDMNAQNVGTEPFCRIIEQFPTLKYIIPPLKVLQGDTTQIKSGMLDYINRIFDTKPIAIQLMLRPNAVLTKGQRDSLVTQSILSRCISMQKSLSGIDKNIFTAVLQLKDIFDKEVKPLLDQHVPTNISGPIVEELAGQYQTLRAIVLNIDADMQDVLQSSKNSILASDHSKQVAQLINSNIMPESWCTGFMNPPTSTAPLGNPELATLANGKPENFIRMLPICFKTIHSAITHSDSHEISIQYMPRPPAIMEALRRYEGNLHGIELDKVHLYGSITRPSGKCIVLSPGSLCLEGAACTGARLDFDTQQSAVQQVYITSEEPAEQLRIQLYVDQQRETQMPIIGEVHYPGGAELQREVNLYGVYLHLSSR